MDVLIIGGGGREHALAWKVRQSNKVGKIFCAPGNAGTASLAENINIEAEDIMSLLEFAEQRKVGLTVVGPEQPLVKGLADKFREKELPVFGPSARAAQIEGSKKFCKDLMLKYGIPTGEYRTFESAEEARRYVKGIGPVVVKADGLAAGKGVILCQTEEQALGAINKLMVEKTFGLAGKTVLIEEFLEGVELSFLAFSDGKTLLPLETAQDHKAAFDGDTGPNTGGMGAYSPANVLSRKLFDRVILEIMYPAINALNAEGCPFQGLLYAGLMLTSSGPKVLEFNARFGDPETQPLMMRLKNDIVDLMLACEEGTLSEHRLDWNPQFSVCVVMAAGGYPESYAKGMAIDGLDFAESAENVVIFHAGTRLKEDGSVLCNGGRVLGVTALGKTLDAAIESSYAAVDKISWDGVHFRKDIGRRDK